METQMHIDDPENSTYPVVFTGVKLSDNHVATVTFHALNKVEMSGVALRLYDHKQGFSVSDFVLYMLFNDDLSVMRNAKSSGNNPYAQPWIADQVRKLAERVITKEMMG